MIMTGRYKVTGQVFTVSLPALFIFPLYFGLFSVCPFCGTKLSHKSNEPALYSNEPSFYLGQVKTP